MERSEIAVFVQVVREGSFTTAAEALGLSKSAVSKYVSRLEARLGSRLLHRTTRKLTLTDVGESFFRRVERALAAIVEAEQEAGEQAAAPRGHLRVSAPAFYGAEVLSRRLGSFHRRYPDISLELILENRFVNLIEERIDVALRMSAPRDSSLIMRRLARIPIVVCASPEYLERHGRPAAPQDLREHSCLIYTLASRMHEWTFRGDDNRFYSVAIGGHFRTNDDHMMRQAALDGLGILRMPRLFLEDALAQGTLVQLWPDTSGPEVTLAAVYASRQELPARVRAFVDFVAEAA